MRRMWDLFNGITRLPLKKKRLNGFPRGCVRDHMDTSTSPRFIHVSFDINNAPVSSGVWNTSKTIIKLPWKLRSSARRRHTVSAQITAWKVTANKALDRGAEMRDIKREGGCLEVGRWRYCCKTFFFLHKNN